MSNTTQTPKHPTFLTELSDSLEANGMSQSQAKTVIDRMLAGEKDSSMNGRWLDDPREYPVNMFNVLWLTCSRYALDTINELWPLAWFRPCFLPPSEQAAFLSTKPVEAVCTNQLD